MGELWQPPMWSKVRTHCPRCLRPFATQADEDRHDQGENAGERCDDLSHWCVALCWEKHSGGWCPSADDLPSEDAADLVLIIRALREQAENATPDHTAQVTQPGRTAS